MKRFLVFSVSFGTLVLLMGVLFAPVVAAVPGDVNGDGYPWTLSDLTYLILYLFWDGSAPPNPVDADVDGFPGINMGDVVHFADYFVSGNCWPLPYAGAGVKQSSQIRFSADLIFSMNSGMLDTTWVTILENGGPELSGLVLPLSFASQAGEVEVTLDSVSFDGAVLEGSKTEFITDNVNKTVLLYSSGQVPVGTTGLVATLYFSKTSDGYPLAMSVTDIPPSHSLMLIGPACSMSAPSNDRIFTPKISLALKGDVNCDGVVNVADAVYITNYLYRGGPPPCGL
ncbi:MAG: hypothetical protein JSV10_10240 [Candidatus Zixiibacteriota bacterium]|nr:MAG: hypothetical protein JSV10_10240 [candidate division Zixibacteria bacterium]